MLIALYHFALVDAWRDHEVAGGSGEAKGFGDNSARARHEAVIEMAEIVGDEILKRLKTYPEDEGSP